MFSSSAALTLLLNNLWGTAPAHCHPNTNSAVKHLVCEFLAWLLLRIYWPHASESYLLMPVVWVGKWGQRKLACHWPLGFVTSIHFNSVLSHYLGLLLLFFLSSSLFFFFFSLLKIVPYVLWDKALSLAKFPTSFSLHVKLQAPGGFLALWFSC